MQSGEPLNTVTCQLRAAQKRPPVSGEPLKTGTSDTAAGRSKQNWHEPAEIRSKQSRVTQQRHATHLFCSHNNKLPATCHAFVTCPTPRSTLQLSRYLFPKGAAQVADSPHHVDISVCSHLFASSKASSSVMVHSPFRSPHGIANEVPSAFRHRY